MIATSDTHAVLGVVVVITTHADDARGTFDALAKQSVADRLDVVIVAADEAALGDLASSLAGSFRSIQTVLAGPIDDVERATAEGFERVSASCTALVEDHAFPSEDWAEVTLAGHAAGYDVVGAPMRNANPAGALSWGNMLLAYGAWVEPTPGGEVRSLQGHNVSFRTQVLREFGDELPTLLRREGGLMDRLGEKGARFVLTGDGSIAHVNPSSFSATARLRVDAGRLYGAQRSVAEGWSAAKRLLYVIAAPLIPLVRLRRLYPEHFGNGRRAGQRERALVGLVSCLLLDAFGQMIGYAVGPGMAGARLAKIEIGRAGHLTARDRMRLYGRLAR